MTIEEIIEMRMNYMITRHVKNRGLAIIDTLLAEVSTLEKHNASSDQDVVTLDQQLTIATEALESIAYNPLVHSNNQQSEMRPDDIAITALKRMKE